MEQMAVLLLKKTNFLSHYLQVQQMAQNETSTNKVYSQHSAIKIYNQTLSTLHNQDI